MAAKKAPELSVIMFAAQDDPPLYSEEFQAGLEAFAQSLAAHGIKFSSRLRMMESASGGGFALGEFGITATSIPPILAGLIGAWLQAKYGRKVKLKFDDVEAEAANVNEVERLIKLAEEHKKKRAEK